MPDVFALLALLLLLALPAYLLLDQLAPPQQAVASWLESLFATFSLMIVLFGWLALLLVEWGHYRFSNLLLLWLLLTAVLFIRRWRQPRPFGWPNWQTAGNKWQRPFLLLWLLAALWLFFRPHQFITGDGDGGVYINLAAHIAQTGQLQVIDPVLAAMEPNLQQLVLRPIYNPVVDSYWMPAFFVTDESIGQLTPQFYPLHPVWYAIATSLGGVSTALLLNGAWALLGSLAIYLFVRQIGAWPVAALALLGLSLNGLQVWFARYPTSEMVTQYLLWSGIWATAVWLKPANRSWLWPLLAGGSFGSLFLARIDSLFLLPLFIFVLVWQWRRRQTGLVLFAVPLLGLLLHSLIHAVWQSAPYFYDLYEYAILTVTRGEVGLMLLTAVGTASLLLFAAAYPLLVRFWHTYQRPLLTLAIVGLGVLALYAWFIRPWHDLPVSYTDQFSSQNVTSLDHETLIRLGWYVSPLGIALGVIGIGLLVWRVQWQTAVMLLITLFFSLFYLWSLRNNPVHVYGMRRYVPATLPLFVIGAAYAIAALPSLLRRWWPAHGRWLATLPALLLALLWLGNTAVAGQRLIRQVDFVGIPDQLASFASRLDSHAIILWNEQRPITLGDHLAAPLRFQYGHDLYILRQPEQLDEAALVRAIEAWQNNGRTVYWVGDPAWRSIQERLGPGQAVTFSSNFLEATTGHKPTAVVPLQWGFHLYTLQ